MPNPFSWPNSYQGAISLSYDDGMTMHREDVAPLLEDNGLRGTFYVPIHSEDFRDAVDGWRNVATAGHELGNHTIYHPCYNAAESEFGQDWYQGGWRNLEFYSEERLRQEFEISNFVLSLVDGKDPNDRTYGNTCGHNTIGPRDAQQIFDPILSEYFVASRGTRMNVSVDPASANFADLGSTGADQRAANDVIAEIEALIARGHWGIYWMHGVGVHDRYGIDRHSARNRNWIDPDEHRRLVLYLAKNRDRIWTAPVVEIAKHIAQT